MFRLANPYYLLLLLPLGFAAWWVFRRRSVPGLAFNWRARIPAPPRTWRIRAAAVCPALFLLGLALSTVALARPQKVFSRIWRNTEAIAIQMVVDVSGSMEALDFSTADRRRSRLDAVKDTFAEFIGQRPNDLVGLVTFGGYATSRVPLTIDHDALLHVLKGVEIPKPTLGSDGNVANQEEMLTAIGDGLATACGRLEHAVAKSRIAVLLSDGESNTGIIKPADASRAAKTLGVRVYTIGVGSNGRAPFIVRDMLGREQVQYANVTLDEKVLREIAQTTGGQYFNVRDPKGLRKAMEDIDRLEKTTIRSEIYSQYQELFLSFLLPGVALMLTAAGLNIAVSRLFV